MNFAFHQLCPRYSRTLTPTAPTAIRLWETFTFLIYVQIAIAKSKLNQIVLMHQVVIFQNSCLRCVN